MKPIYTLIFWGCSLTLLGQYDNFLVGMQTGVTIGTEGLGNGLSYGVDLQKHIALGIYGQLIYSSGHLERGENHPRESGGFDYQSDILLQHRSVAIGLRKEMQVSLRGRVGLSLGATYVTQSKVEWELGFSPFGDLDLSASQERYGQRDDLGYAISAEYIHRMNHIVRLGAYAGYQSQPSLVNVGLRILAALNKVDGQENPNRKPLSNFLEFRIGSLGGDGVSPVFHYTLVYGRNLSKRFSAYAKMGIGKGFTDKDPASYLEFFDEEELLQFESEFLTDDHEGGNTIFHPIQHSIYGVGVRFALNVEGKSSLSISGGLGIYQTDVVDVSTIGTTLEFYSETYERISEISPELGLHYEYRVSDYFYLGGNVGYAYGRINFNAGVHAGLRF